MRNPLNKRIPRELKSDFLKYFVIFVFLTGLIGIVSGFLVVDDSFYTTYINGFVDQNVEDGHVTFDQVLTDEMMKEIEEQADVTLTTYDYFEEQLNDTSKNIRVYQAERNVNLLSVISGDLPGNNNEIAIDRMFADNNEIVVGDKITLKDTTFTVSGLIASPDYSSLFENNSDMMFDSINFGIAVLSEDAFENFNTSHRSYNYVWKYPVVIEREDKETAKQYSDDFVDVLEDVLTANGDRVLDQVVEYGKLLFLDEAFKEVENQLSVYGMSLDIYDNEEGYTQLLDTINDVIENEGIDLSQELSEGERSVTLNVGDIEKAMHVTSEELDQAQAYIDHIDDEIVEVTDYLPRYLNQAINFTGDDMGGDKEMILVFSYIMILVLAFVFAVTITSAIVTEAGVIGTLRATGYSRGTLVRHYMVLPIIVSFIAAILGNILGYTVFNDVFVDIYNTSFSLAKYEQLTSPDAFILTTVIPLIIMIIVNVIVLSVKLRLSPLRFLRRDLGRKTKKKAFHLSSKISFMNRFRLRIIFQNLSSYLVLAIGIFIGGLLFVFGTMFVPLLDDYKEIVLSESIADYQYVLKDQIEVDNIQAEKFNLTSLSTISDKFLEDEVSLYGIEEDSAYILADVEDGNIVISSAFAAKYGLSTGDEIEFKDPYNSKKRYTFTVDDVYEYESGLSLFMSRDMYSDIFDEDEDYFTGYFSNEVLDIDEDDIATVITIDDLTKVSDQLTVSMGSMMSVIQVFAVITFALLMFLLSKQIIEKNATSISMVKILGFKDGEIGSLYLVATSVVVVLSLLVTIPLCDAALRWIFAEIIYTEMTGYIPYIVSNKCYYMMVIAGIACYAFIAVCLLKKIERIPKSDALKNDE